MFTVLRREYTIASPGYNRWMFPPASLLVQLSVGQVYGFSVFSKPLTQLCTRECENWTIVQVGWLYTTMFVFLGLSATLFGHRLEILGPRIAGIIATVFWSSGYFMFGAGVYYHSMILMCTGACIGGIGLGCGYISPISTFLKWFPDMPGIATGLAIMGFGGGAVVGAPLAVILLERYAVWKVFCILGILSGIFLLSGTIMFRIPPHEWMSDKQRDVGKISKFNYSVSEATRTLQFWCLWIAMCTNIACGTAILGQASMMVQDTFHMSAVKAGSMVGLLSIFNTAGRFLWSSLSDKIGCNIVYTIFFVLGICLYALLPSTIATKNFAAFFTCISIIVSMFGGGFSVSPSYIANIFGIKNSGAIHARMLSSLSVAAILGPALLNNMREHEVHIGRPISSAYNTSFYTMAGILTIGLVGSLLIPYFHKICSTTDTPACNNVDYTESCIIDFIPVFNFKCPSVTELNTPASKQEERSGINHKQIAGILLLYVVPVFVIAWGIYAVFIQFVRSNNE